MAEEAGLTLIEVLVAASLMGIMMALAAPNFTDMQPGFRARAAALAVAGDINQARMMAIKEGRVYEYFPITGGYRIRRDDGLGGRQVVKEVVIATQYPHVAFGHGSIANDPYAVAIAADSPAATITFHSDGSVQNPASVYLQSANRGGPILQAVTLSAAGRVRVWKGAGNTWK
jgi:prepilin-type N-terminal cleavage/methylation domain-containing protein